MQGYEIVRVSGQRGTHHEARFQFDAEDCENIAYALGLHDAGAVELLKAAEDCRTADEPDEDAPGLRIGVVLAEGPIYLDPDNAERPLSREPVDES